MAEQKSLLPELYKEEDERALNNTELVGKRIEELKQTLKRELQLPDSAEIVDITFYGDIPLGGQLAVENCYSLTIVDGEDQFSLLTKEDYSKIATIDRFGELELDEDYKAKLLQGQTLDLQTGISEGVIGLPGYQNEQQKEFYDLDERYYLEGDKEPDNLVAVAKGDKQDEKLKKEVAKGLDEDSDKIISIIEIKDKKEFSRIFNKAMDNTSTVYLIRYANDKFNLVEKNANGTFELVKGLEVSGLSTDIAIELNLKNNREQRIEKGKVLSKTTIGGMPERLEDGELQPANNLGNVVIIRKPGIERPNVAIEQDTRGNVTASLSTENSDKEVLLSTEVIYPSDVTLAKQSQASQRKGDIANKLYELELYKELLVIEERILQIESSSEVGDMAIGALSGATTGAVIGTLLGPTGTGIGAIAGGIHGAEEHAEAAREDKQLTLRELEKDKSTIINKLNEPRQLNKLVIEKEIEDLEEDPHIRVPWPKSSH